MNVAFIVEGNLEKAFIENACVGAPVKKVIPNGVTVSVEVMAERILTHYRLLERKNFSHIVILLDREGRQQCWRELRAALEGILARNGADRAIVGVCNRKIENWILADPATVGQERIDDPEAVGGKGYIKQVLGEYHETTIGVKLLKAARPSVMRENSPSFREFSDRIAELNCWWLAR